MNKIIAENLCKELQDIFPGVLADKTGSGPDQKRLGIGIVISDMMRESERYTISRSTEMLSGSLRKGFENHGDTWLDGKLPRLRVWNDERAIFAEVYGKV